MAYVIKAATIPAKLQWTHSTDGGINFRHYDEYLMVEVVCRVPEEALGKVGIYDSLIFADLKPCPASASSNLGSWGS